jgi:hypothetical protein
MIATNRRKSSPWWRDFDLLRDDGGIWVPAGREIGAEAGSACTIGKSRIYADGESHKRVQDATLRK